MKYNYFCFKGQYYHEDIGDYTSYGIQLEGDDEARVDDVSTEEDFVTETVRILNEYQVSPVHLYDVVEDRLAGVR